MILDRVENCARYFALHPAFRTAFEYLRRTRFDELSAGRHEIDGDRLFLVMNRGHGRGRKGARLEAHRKYIDIQYTLDGTDEIGWKATPACTQIAIPFDAEKDVGFFGDAPEAWVAVPPGRFTIFYPEDAHAPMGSECELVKAVLKIAVDWH